MLFFSFFKLMFLVAGLAFYFLPTLIAHSRRSQSTSGIFVVNLLLGWTFIGWVAALVWAATSERRYYGYVHY